MLFSVVVVTIILSKTSAESFLGRSRWLKIMEMPVTLEVSQRLSRPARSCPASASRPAQRVSSVSQRDWLLRPRAMHLSYLPIFLVSHIDSLRRVLTEQGNEILCNVTARKCLIGGSPGSPGPCR